MTVHVNVMAPLVIGDPADPDGEKSAPKWNEFRKQLKVMKDAGVYAMFFDYWWGLLDKERYYRKLVDMVVEEGLNVVPNISLHQCGGNVGDDAFIPIPSDVWKRLAQKTPSGNVDDLKYVSEQGHASDECISCFAMPWAMEEVRAVMKTIRERHADHKDHIVEVTVSLGPAGEMRYPSYNSHDKDSGFPKRGALQFYSQPARKSFEDWVLKKYGDREGVRKAWGNLENIEPPVDPDAFFRDDVHINTQYGRDVFDWSQEALLEGERLVIEAAIEEFAAWGTPIGAKVPGVHWMMGHWDGGNLVMGKRLPELSAGMIRTSDKSDWESDEAGRGYRPLIGFFKHLQEKHASTHIVMHFTCLEKSDGEDADMGAESLAGSLVKWVGQEAQRQGVEIKGENALGWNLPKRKSWTMLRKALNMPGTTGSYEGLTLLRITDITSSKVATTKLKALIKWVDRCRSRKKVA